MAVFGLLMGIAVTANGADFKYENKPENLKALFELIHQTVHGKKDNKGATALFGGMIPNEARAKADIYLVLLAW